MKDEHEDDINIILDDLTWEVETNPNKNTNRKTTHVSLREKKVECVICMEMTTQQILTACGHHFCVSCFDIWYESEEGSKKCPICRQHVSLDEIHVNGQTHRFNMKKKSSFAKYTKPVRIVEPGGQNINQIRLGSSCFHYNDVGEISFVAAFAVYVLLGILLYILYNRWN